MKKTISVGDLRLVAEKCVEEEPSRMGTEGWCRKPLLFTAPADERFDILGKIAYSSVKLNQTLKIYSGSSPRMYFISSIPGISKEN